jgi:hypothetical protein
LQEAVAHQESEGEALRRVLAQGLGRFRQVVTEGKLELPRHGSWEIASIVRGERPPARPNLQFLGALLSSNPNYTGWPVWLDSRNFVDQTARPYLANEVWEAFIARFGAGSSDHLEFWRLSPAGEFYLYRAFQDDVPVRDRGPAPMTEFDFGLPVIRVAEAIGVALAYARAVGTSGAGAAVLLRFRWTGLQGRELTMSHTAIGAVTTFTIDTDSTPESWCLGILDTVAGHHDCYRIHRATRGWRYTARNPGRRCWPPWRNTDLRTSQHSQVGFERVHQMVSQRDRQTTRNASRAVVTE